MGKTGRERKAHPDANIDDWHLWSRVTRSVSPLRKARSGGVFGKKQQAETFSPDQTEELTQKEPKRQYWAPSYSPPVQKSHNTIPAIEPGVKRRLTRGHLSIDATIDLHGLRQDEAHAALCRFISARYQRGDRTLLVITGKGLRKSGTAASQQRGILRVMLPIWLSEQRIGPMVAGWEISARKHGGEGALYVRLKRFAT